MTPVHVQLGLFGVDNTLAAFHVVSAHTRVQADGSEVFVGEHLRWNRGRTGERAGLPRSPAPEADDPAQPSLFPRSCGRVRASAHRR
jgi:hypothetical protein